MKKVYLFDFITKIIVQDNLQTVYSFERGGDTINRNQVKLCAGFGHTSVSRVISV